MTADKFADMARELAHAIYDADDEMAYMPGMVTIPVIAAAIRKAVEDEREACAVLVVDEWGFSEPTVSGDIADKIRERGK